MPGIGQTQKELQVQINNLKKTEAKGKPHVEMDVFRLKKKKKKKRKKEKTQDSE